MNEKTNIFKNLFVVTKYIYDFKPLYICVSILSSILNGVIPIVMLLLNQNIMNMIQEGKTLRGLLLITILYIGTDLIYGQFLNYSKFYINKIFLEFNIDMNKKILNKAKNLSLADYENSEVYDKITRAQDESYGRMMEYFNAFLTIGSNLISTVSYFVILATFNPIFLIILFIGPLSRFVITRKLNIESFHIKRERTNDERKAWYYGYLITHGLFYKELKINMLFNHFIDKGIGLYRTFKDQDVDISRRSTFYAFFLIFLERLLDAVIIVQIVVAGFYSRMMLGNVMTYLNSISQTKIKLTAILNSFSQLSRDSLFISQLGEYLSLHEEEDGKVRIDSIENIRIENLFYKYRNSEEYSLKNVCLDIKRNDLILFVGKNGSGKTTLIKILLGLYADYEGKVYINGVDLKEIDKKKLYERMSVLFQDYAKYEGSIRVNVAYSNLKEINDNVKIMELVKTVGLAKLKRSTDNLLDVQLGQWFNNAKQISSGQWQRLALARVFFKESDFYILDEPSSSLDNESTEQLADLYKEKIDKSIGIIVTHNISKFVNISNKIVVLDKGEIVCVGEHSELIKNNDIYTDLFNAEMG